MSQTLQRSEESKIKDLISELEEDEEDDSMDPDEARAYTSMALSVVITSVLMQVVPVLNGIIVGIALWLVVGEACSKSMKKLGWYVEDEEKDDLEILKEAYQRGLISEKQLEESIENTS